MSTTHNNSIPFSVPKAMNDSLTTLEQKDKVVLPNSGLQSYGKIIVKDREYELLKSIYTFGRKDECNFNVKKDSAAETHAVLKYISPNNILLSIPKATFQEGYSVIHNNKLMTERNVRLNFGDSFIIAGKLFIFEHPGTVLSNSCNTTTNSNTLKESFEFNIANSSQNAPLRSPHHTSTTQTTTTTIKSQEPEQKDLETAKEEKDLPEKSEKKGEKSESKNAKKIEKRKDLYDQENKEQHEKKQKVNEKASPASSRLNKRNEINSLLQQAEKWASREDKTRLRGMRSSSLSPQKHRTPITMRRKSFPFQTETPPRKSSRLTPQCSPSTTKSPQNIVIKITQAERPISPHPQIKHTATKKFFLSPLIEKIVSSKRETKKPDRLTFE